MSGTSELTESATASQLRARLSTLDPPQPTTPSKRRVSHIHDTAPAYRPETSANSIPASAVLLEESFDGIVEEVRHDSVGLRLVSSDGEESIAWLPIAKIPIAERPYLEIGAPIRIAIVMTQAPDRREERIRILRPEQWKLPPTSRDRASDFLYELIQRNLGPGDVEAIPSTTKR